MSGMFGVRSTRALTPNSLESGLPPVHAACAAAAPHTLPPPGLHLAPHRMPLPSTRQRTNTFNQPLSFDTSKVTTMKDMFHVRSARALTPSRHGSGLPPCMPLAPPPPHALPPPGAHLAPLRMCPSLSTRQLAYGFNQPLSFDTSKVTNMYRMFRVRSARALTPSRHGSGLPPRACPLAPPPPHALPPPGPHLAPHRMPLPSTRQSAHAFNQPLSFDTSKVTNMKNMFNVRSARALTLTTWFRPSPVHARLRRHRLTPSHLPARTSPRIACPSLRLGRARRRSTSR